MSELTPEVLDLPQGSLGQQIDVCATGVSHMSLANGSKTSPSLMPEVRVEVVSDESSDSHDNAVQNKSISPSSVGSVGKEVMTSQEDPWQDFEPPNEELKNKIIQQVEFYFSDENIVKDAFLLKHIKRNKQGYISLKLISSFKKVKSLTKDWRHVAYSLKLSDKLEVNHENSKVRRVDPLPEKAFEEVPTKTVLAINLPFSNPSIEQLADLFGSCGEIALISILKPGKPVPQDIKQFSSKHPEIGSTICGLIEFEQTESAKLACQKLNDCTNWRTGMRVVELAKARKVKEKKEVKQDIENVESKQNDNVQADDNMSKAKKKRKQRNKNLDSVAKEGEHGYTTSGSEAENLPWRARSGSNLSVEGRSSPHQLTPQHSPRGSPRFQRRPRSGSYLTPDGSGDGGSKPASREGSPDTRKRGDSSASSSPWVQRRRLLAAGGATNVQGSPASSPLLGRKNLDGSINAVSLTRQPVAPEEVVAFYGGKGRGKPCSSTSPM